MHRRAVVMALASVPLLLASRTVYAGSYLDRSGLLLEGSRKDADALRAKMTDKELARLIEAVADARETAASKMDVPASVAKAHPHLLLSLSKVERAAQAAMGGSYATVVEHLDAARREESIFRAALKDLGFPLPSNS